MKPLAECTTPEEFTARAKEITLELESVGLVKRTGQFKRNPATGKLEPTFVAVKMPEEEAQRRLRALNNTTETEQ
jgi:hypothetical protein